MRLHKNAQSIIHRTAAEIFGPEVNVYLFGSRTDDSAKGGDIDLLVQLDKPVNEKERKILKLVARLQIRLGDQPIDVLVQDPETVLQPVHNEALRMGIRL